MKKIKKYILFVAMLAIANQAHTMDLPEFIYDVVSDHLSLDKQLYYNIKFNKLEKIYSMIAHNEFEPFMERIDGYNPFALAIKFQRPEVMNIILQQCQNTGYDINTKNCRIDVEYMTGMRDEESHCRDEWRSPLRFAIEYNRWGAYPDSGYMSMKDDHPLQDNEKEIIIMLLNAGAKDDLSLYDIQRLVHAEITYNYPDSVHGETPLVQAARQANDRRYYDLIPGLIDMGSNPTIPNTDGRLAQELVPTNVRTYDVGCDVGCLVSQEELDAVAPNLQKYYTLFCGGSVLK